MRVSLSRGHFIPGPVMPEGAWAALDVSVSRVLRPSRGPLTKYIKNGMKWVAMARHGLLSTSPDAEFRGATRWLGPAPK